ncbi:MAG: cupredoxin domain-containing protein [Acidimicrobiia bacterium]
MSKKISGVVLSAVLVTFLVAAVPAGAGTGRQDGGYPHPADVWASSGWKYMPENVTITRGSKLKFGNYDLTGGIPAHSLDERVPNCTAAPYTGENCSYPRFSSGLTDHGQVHYVAGVEKLPPGTYPFSCQAHSQMYGTLIVK